MCTTPVLDPELPTSPKIVKNKKNRPLKGNLKFSVLKHSAMSYTSMLALLFILPLKPISVLSFVVFIRVFVDFFHDDVSQLPILVQIFQQQKTASLNSVY